VRIGIVSTLSFPIPYHTHTGDVVILDLISSLIDLGHEIHLFAPDGTVPPEKTILHPTMATYGKSSPTSVDCALDCLNKYKNILLNLDIIHDFSTCKVVAEHLFQLGKTSVISTLMGGCWKHDYGPHNLIVWSNAHRDRVLRGATDYENTPTPDLAGPNGHKVKEAKVVYGGIDTNYYSPTYEKSNFFLWMNRWHEAKGYYFAINLAKTNPNYDFVIAGTRPEDEIFEYQKNCAIQAIYNAKNIPNIHFEWLPKDPEHHIAKRNLYRKAKALIYSVQFHEPFGLSQVEAMACGTPVIGTNYGSVPEVIDKGITGYVCENNIKHFSEALSKINYIDLVKCRNQSVIRFDKLMMAKSYVNKYIEILNGNGWC